MKLFAFLTYIVVEIAAFAGLVSWLGFGWAVLAMIGATVLGVIMLRRTAAGVLRDLGQALDGQRSAGPALMDTAILAAAVFLLAVPGVVSTALGLLLLIKPVRAVVRPAVAYVGAKRVASFVEESGLVTVLAGQPRGYGTVVDGDVVTGTTRTDEPVVDVTGPGQGGPRPGFRELPPA